MTALPTLEVETQRQHPRFKLPLKVVVSGRQYLAADWSVGGVAINNPGSDLTPGTVVELELQFPLANYSISNRFRATVKYVRTDLNRAGLEFTDVTLAQTSLLRFMIDKYLAGDLHQADDVVVFMQRDTTSNARKDAREQKPESVFSRFGTVLKRTLGSLLMVGLLLAALGYLGFSMYQRVFVFQPQSSFISAELIPVRAPESGTISQVFEGTEVQSGDLLFTLKSADGSGDYQVHSQCDCDLVTQKPREGDFYRSGDKIVSLYSPVLEPYLQVKVAFDDLLRLEKARSATVTFLDGTTLDIPALAENLAGNHIDTGRLQDALFVRLPLPGNIRPDQIGEPGLVSFDTSGRIGVWLGTIGQQIVSLVKGEGNLPDRIADTTGTTAK